MQLQGFTRVTFRTWCDLILQALAACDSTLASAPKLLWLEPSSCPILSFLISVTPLQIDPVQVHGPFTPALCPWIFFVYLAWSSRWAPTHVFNWYIFAWHLHVHLHLEFWWESPAQCSPYCTLHSTQNPLYQLLFHLIWWKLHPCRCSGHIWTLTSLSLHIWSHWLYLEDISRDFSDGPVVKTLCSQYREAWVQSLVMELDPTCCN